MRIALVEDNIRTQKTVIGFLEKVHIKNTLVFTSTNVNNSIKQFNENEIDLAILDIELEDGTVFDVLKNLRSIEFKIIFFSSMDTYAIDAFLFSALNYIIKPLLYNEFLKEILKVQQHLKIIETLENQKKKIDVLEKIILHKEVSTVALPSSSGVDFIKIKDIIYGKADANYCFFYTHKEKRFYVSKPLKSFVNILEKSNFYRVHKTYIVNLKFIEKYSNDEGGKVILNNGDEIPVSRRKKEGLLRALRFEK